ncbi:ATP-binding protein [Oceaniserpentilla sp. 4NH20-0058]|uniref:sensor histidine kinase n=1 Tax=Oceaniserpentilla sp. 4NH20-0058 TaxID=3127660 RepID=UPI0031089AA9
METSHLDTPFLPLDRLRILKYFSVYSAIITAGLMSLFFMDIDLGFLGQADPKIYPMILSFHAVMTIVFIVLAFSVGQAHYDHLIAFFLIDITLVAGLIYSSGSGTSLSYLMVINIAVGNALVSGQKGYLLSAWAAICLVYIEYFFQENGFAYNFVNAGTLGVIFFISALIIQALVKRLHLSVDINRQQADSLLSMEQLTRLVLKRLETGVVVIDNQSNIIFQNSAAQRLLGYPGAIRSLPEKLQDRYHQYEKFPKYKPEPFKAGPTTAKVQIMFSPLMPGTNRGTVIFIEDTNVVYQQAQRLKQQSLGKLSASIVREIREPMKGIYQIAKHMSKSLVASGDTKRHEQIKNHSVRIDRIIRNVQSLSNSKATEFEKTPIGKWTYALTKSLQTSLLKDVVLQVKTNKLPMEVYCDRSQIQQAVTNLLENAVYFSKQQNGNSARIIVLVGENKVSRETVIEIQDNGYGVGLDDLDHIFEPFYTSEENKSGLGLYLAKQFCEMNMARLDYIATQQGARFRITFPDPEQVKRQLEQEEDFKLRDKAHTEGVS